MSVVKRKPALLPPPFFQLRTPDDPSPRDRAPAKPGATFGPVTHYRLGVLVTGGRPKRWYTR